MRARAILSFAAGLAILCAGIAEAKLVEKSIQYQQEGATANGFLVYDDAKSGTRPAVLVIPEWWGLNDYPKSRARQLASMGYVAFAADMYGNGKITRDPKEAQALAAPFYSNPAMFASRTKAALDVLLKQPQSDAMRVAAIGFCFGGSAVLQLAYSGAPLNAAVTFHGGLMPADAAQQKRIKTSILILHGSEDPMVPQADRDKTHQSLDAAGIDWQMVLYGNAVHGFTDPDSDSHKIPGLAYNEKAARRAWDEMQRFFQEKFGK
jgi:dienelactone hydrolase